jgi:CRISPR/Cas system-associated endonuclease Cas3-HD
MVANKQYIWGKAIIFECMNEHKQRGLSIFSSCYSSSHSGTQYILYLDKEKSLKKDSLQAAYFLVDTTERCVLTPIVS